jgi:hypothetical protein
MRLLHTSTLEFKDFFEPHIPNYAIQSHRWVDSEEVSYEDFIEGRKKDSSGYDKIVQSCEFAKRYYYEYYSDAQRITEYNPPEENLGELKNSSDLEWMWIDTCCIDKRNLVELSEAINSMHTWYSQAKVCLAYLNDFDRNAIE